MVFKIINYFRNLFRKEECVFNSIKVDGDISETPDISSSEIDDSDFDENGFIKSQEALNRRKKKLQKEWLQEMPEILEKYQSANAHIFQKYNEESTRFQIYQHIFDFYDLSKVLVLDGTEIEYAVIKDVKHYFHTEWGLERNWVDSYACIEILLEDNRNFTIQIVYDPYNVSDNLLEKLLEIENR